MKFFSLIKPVFAQEDIDNFDALVGEVRAPAGVGTVNIEAGGGIGILLMISRLLQVVTVIASVWVALNIIFAAYTYLSGAGKADNHQKVNNILTMSVVGLIFIVTAYTFAGLIGLLFFGDAAYIINPTIKPIGG